MATTVAEVYHTTTTTQQQSSGSNQAPQQREPPAQGNQASQQRGPHSPWWGADPWQQAKTDQNLLAARGLMIPDFSRLPQSDLDAGLPNQKGLF